MWLFNNKDIGVDTKQHSSHNSQKRQYKINAQAAEIATVKKELNIALQENKKLKDLFNPENGRGHDQSGQCNDCEGAPKNISGHLV